MKLYDILYKYEDYFKDNSSLSTSKEQAQLINFIFELLKIIKIDYKDFEKIYKKNEIKVSYFELENIKTEILINLISNDYDKILLNIQYLQKIVDNNLK